MKVYNMVVDGPAVQISASIVHFNVILHVACRSMFCDWFSLYQVTSVKWSDLLVFLGPNVLAEQQITR